MSKQPSDATVIRTLRRNLREEHEAAIRHAKDAQILRGQLTKAQQEIADWKRRFDLLLANSTVQIKEPPY